MSANPLRPLLNRCSIGFTVGQKLLILAGAVLYALSPIDLLPDFIPVVGVCDDFYVLCVLIRVLAAPTLPRRPGGPQNSDTALALHAPREEVRS